MNEEFQEDMKFDAAAEAADDGEGLILDMDGYGGPLHLLLELARKQKVDLARLSILELAEQYIACLLYTSPSPRDQRGSRMPSSA